MSHSSGASHNSGNSGNNRFGSSMFPSNAAAKYNNNNNNKNKNSNNNNSNGGGDVFEFLSDVSNGGSANSAAVIAEDDEDDISEEDEDELVSMALETGGDAAAVTAAFDSKYATTQQQQQQQQPPSSFNSSLKKRHTTTTATATTTATTSSIHGGQYFADRRSHHHHRVHVAAPGAAAPPPPPPPTTTTTAASSSIIDGAFPASASVASKRSTVSTFIGSSAPRPSFWSKLATDRREWDTTTDDFFPRTTPPSNNNTNTTNNNNNNNMWQQRPRHTKSQSCIQRSSTSFLHTTRTTISTLAASPIILFVTLLTFATLLTIGLAITRNLITSHETDLQQHAHYRAHEMGRWLSTTLDDSLFPLKSISQLVNNVQLLKNLPLQFKHTLDNDTNDDHHTQQDDPDSAASLFESSPTTTTTTMTTTHNRNVSGICDDPTLITLFHQMASTLKKDAKLERILLNIQLAPQAIVCLSYPPLIIVNTMTTTTTTTSKHRQQQPENDHDEDLLLIFNHTEDIGHDLLTDPNHVDMVQTAIQSSNTIILKGPFLLPQQQQQQQQHHNNNIINNNYINNDTSPILQEVLLARMAIPMDGYQLTVNNIQYPVWGIVTILLNWTAFKEKSGIHEIFTHSNMEYHLTKTDRFFNTTNERYYENVVTIASSDRYFVLNDRNSVSTKFNTTTDNNNNNIWTVTVGYEDGFSRPLWKDPFILFVIITSFLLAFMLMMLLVSNRQLLHLIYRMVPKNIIKRIRRGETILERYNTATVLFSDIAGFTLLSGSMSPTEIMDLLNEIYAAFDELAAKHRAYKVETIGDSYIVIGGGPDRSMGRVGAERVALFALDALEFVRTFQPKNHINYNNNLNNNNNNAGDNDHGDDDDNGGTTTNNSNNTATFRIQIRVGLATGPCIGGVIGTTMPKFTLFGDIVHLASKMESTGSGMRIQCSEMTYRLLRDAPNYRFHFMERRNDYPHPSSSSSNNNNNTTNNPSSSSSVGVYIKGRGLEHTWWIMGATPLRQDHADMIFNINNNNNNHCDNDNNPMENNNSNNNRSNNSKTSSSGRRKHNNDDEEQQNQWKNNTISGTTALETDFSELEESGHYHGENPFQEWFSSH